MTPRRVWQALRGEWGILVIIVAVGALLRFAAIDRFPPGLYRDEAYNGLDALAVLRGYTPVFFAANNGREPLYIYLLALGVRLFGATPGALRVVSAALGTLTIPATYWMGRELYGQRVGLVAAWLAATTVWTLNLSRVAFRAVSMPLLVALGLACLWRGLRLRRPLWCALGGLAYGLVFYTYLAARFTPVALLGFVVYLAVWRREWLWGRGWLAFGAVALLAMVPLGAYMVGHRAELLGRAAQVAVWNPAVHGGDLWGTLVRHVARTVAGFFWRGDFGPRHNVPLRPVFDPLTALMLATGCLTAARGLRGEPAHALSLTWVTAMLLPTVLAEDAPHMLRASGVLPVLFLLPAIGVDRLWNWMGNRRGAGVGASVAVILLAYGSVSGPVAYFLHLRTSAAFYQFEAGATELAVTANRFLGLGWTGTGIVERHSTNGSVAAPYTRSAYLAPRLWESWPSVRYLCAAAKDGGLLSTDLDDVALAEAHDVIVVIWPFEEYDAALSALPAGRLILVEEGAMERGDLEPAARLLYVSLWTADPDAAPTNVGRRWEGGIELVGQEIQQRDDGDLVVDLYWRTDRPQPVAYTAFVHVLEGGILAAQHDGPPALGYYGTERWRVGEIVRDRHIVPQGSAGSEGAAREIRVGLYHRDTMEHLALLDDRGHVTHVTSLALAQ